MHLGWASQRVINLIIQLQHFHVGKLLIVLVLSALLTLAVVGKPQNGPGSQRLSKSSKARDTHAARLQILQRELPKLADSALALKNLELRVETVARLADLV